MSQDEQFEEYEISWLVTWKKTHKISVPKFFNRMYECFKNAKPEWTIIFKTWPMSIPVWIISEVLHGDIHGISVQINKLMCYRWI